MKVRLLAIAAASLAGSAAAQLAPPVPSRTPGEIVVATSRALAPRVERAARMVERTAPGVQFRVLAVGSDVAMAELYTARADAAVIGRTASDNEIKAFTWIYGYPPVAAALRPGSVASPGQSPALAVLVNAANPLRAVTPAMLARALSTGHPPPTWRALGVTGPLASRPIHLVMPDAESGTGRFLRTTLIDGRAQFDWARTVEVPTAPGDEAMARRIADAVGHDPLALGFGIALPRRSTRILSVNGLLPTATTYPFSRSIMSYTAAQPTGGLKRLAEMMAADR